MNFAHILRKERVTFVYPPSVGLFHTENIQSFKQPWMSHIFPLEIETTEGLFFFNFKSHHSLQKVEIYIKTAPVLFISHNSQPKSKVVTHY